MSIDYSDMAYPKPQKQKKKKKHKKSIASTTRGVCYMCAADGNRRIQYTQEHHVIFGSGQRADSEEEGLKVYLCLKHHGTGPEGVHGSRAAREKLCRIFQQIWEQTHTRGEWMERFKKNYLN